MLKQKSAQIIAENLKKSGFSLGLSIPKGEPSGLPTYNGDGNGYDVRADE